MNRYFCECPSEFDPAHHCDGEEIEWESFNLSLRVHYSRNEFYIVNRSCKRAFSVGQRILIIGETEHLLAIQEI